MAPLAWILAVLVDGLFLLAPEWLYATGAGLPGYRTPILRIPYPLWRRSGRIGEFGPPYLPCQTALLSRRGGYAIT